MKYLFLASTPLQLLSAYIIANSIHEQDENHLLLLGREEHTWNRCFSLRKMSTDTFTWQKIIIMNNWLGRKSSLATLPTEIGSMKKMLRSINPDHIFLGSDKTTQNQFLVELANKSSFYRMEDGIWSYSSPDRIFLSKLWQATRMKIFRSIAKVKPLLKFNYEGVGRGSSCTADYLFKPFLLERPSPRVVTIEREYIQKAMKKLSAMGGEQYSILSKNRLLLFLGSVWVERKKIPLRQELALIKEIYQLSRQNGLKLLYKPHPSEQKTKLRYYKEHLPDIEFLTIADPIEYIYFMHPNIQAVMAHSSSGLLYADLFGNSQVKTIALLGLYGQRQTDPTLRRILQKAGTHFPLNTTELSTIISSCP
ncbi:MAG: polysialyltransferase family glycosyltransferase [Bacillota bacterium]